MVENSIPKVDREQQKKNLIARGEAELAKMREVSDGYELLLENQKNQTKVWMKKDDENGSIVGTQSFIEGFTKEMW